MVAHRADIAIAAGSFVGAVNAFAKFVTGIIGAWILVIAVERFAGNADPFFAEVIEGARFLVCARPFRILVGAAAFGQADVLGAGIGIVTLQSPLPFALTSNALVICGAGILVVTQLRIVVMGASFQGIAAIVAAGVPVVAWQELAPHTFTIHAEVQQGAFAAIIAGLVIGVEGATVLGVAIVCGADIVVVTTQRVGGYTGTRVTAIANCARVVVAARVVVIVDVIAPGIR